MLELKEQRVRFFFRCIIRKIFTIIFLFLLDNNRLVRAERGTSQAGQTGPIYLGKKFCFVLAGSLATQRGEILLWALSLQSLLKNSSALPLCPVQHGKMVENMLWADAATPAIWSMVFRKEIENEQDLVPVFSCPPSPAMLGWGCLGPRMFCVVL